jgi:hypothetical protein
MMTLTDNQRLVGAKYRSGHEIPTYDDGFGRLWISRNSIGINGIVRAQTWEDAYSICEDEFFPEADETVDELVKEYGYKREYVKMIHPAIRKTEAIMFANGHVEAFDIDYSSVRKAELSDYELTGGRLLDGQFVRWVMIETPDPDAWGENELFCEAYGFRPNGPNGRDKLNHGIYQKDLNGDYLDPLTEEMIEDLGIELVLEDEDEQ